MPKITTFLMFNDQAEQALRLYASVFKALKVSGLSAPGEGQFMGGSFELDGQVFNVFNGGPTFKFSEGISLMVSCKTQAEVDYLWEKLSEGGEPGQCGWLKDRFGVSWQIVPTRLGELLSSDDGAQAQRVVHAMLKMNKLDIAGLERAAKAA